MKKYWWVVYFTDDYSCSEYAFTAEQAKILAQAMRIKFGGAAMKYQKL